MYLPKLSTVASFIPWLTLISVICAGSLADRPLRNSQAKQQVDHYGDPLPPGATLRLGTVRYRSSIGSVVGFLPDSTTVITSTWLKLGIGRKGIRFWDATTGKLLREIDVEASSMRGVALSPDGKRFATALFLPFKENEPIPGAIAICDVVTGKQIQSLKRVSEDVDSCSMAFMPDGRRLVSLGSNGILRIEQIDSGPEILKHEIPNDKIESFALSPNGSTLILTTQANQRQLLIWNWQTGQPPREVELPGPIPGFVGGSKVVFSSDGKTFAFNSADGLCIWDLATRQVLQKLQPPDKNISLFLCAAFSPDCKTLFASYRGPKFGTPGSAHLWETTTWKHIKSFASEYTHGLAVSPDSRLLAATGEVLNVWDLTTGRNLSANDESHASQITRLAASNSSLATSGDDGTIRIWDADSGNHLLKLSHGNRVRAVALSPDGAKLISSSLDGTACLWDVATGKKIHELTGQGRGGNSRAVGFTSDNKHFLTLSDDAILSKWEVATGKAVLTHALRISETKGSEFVLYHNGIFSHDGKTLILDLRKEHRLFDMQTGKELSRLPGEGSQTVGTAISPDGRMLLTSAMGKGGSASMEKNHPICLWELATRRLRHKINIASGTAGPVAFSADGKLFAAGIGGMAPQIRVWETGTGKELAPIKRFASFARSLAFTADSKRLISGMDDTTALVWEVTAQR